MTADTTVVVLGAGINGAAIARELTLSGVGVIVVEEGDIAEGATAWSTRLIHGGLRYLEYGEIGLVRESLAERNRLVRLAPHLVRPLAFYLPLRGRHGGLAAAAARLCGWESLARACRGSRGRGAWAVGVGLSLYDLLAAGDGWPRHRTVRAGSAGLPQVDVKRFPLAALYADAQLLYPERFTVELLVDGREIAASAGTRFDVCTHRHARFAADGRLVIGPGMDGGGAFSVQPAAVINATGAWVDRTLESLRAEEGVRASAVRDPRLIGGTKGSHIILRCPPLREALADQGVYAEAADGRPIFVLPFGAELVLVGTTDIPFAGDPGQVRAEVAEIEYLLGAVQLIFPAIAAGREHVQQHYCGVRPLPYVGGRRAPAGVTRRHLLVKADGVAPPLWSVVGGKLTTCRSLAETTAATVLETLGMRVRDTSRLRPLPGGRADVAPVELGERCRLLAERAGSAEPVRTAQAAVALFGSRAPRVWETDIAEPPHGEPMAAGAVIRGTDLPVAAVGFCAREEWATNLEDLVERRLMLAFHPGLGRDSLDDVARALVRAGMLPGDRREPAVEACAARLRDRYGRKIDGKSPSAVDSVESSPR